MLNLHRADTIPQWETVNPDEWNTFQRVADMTEGVITPANMATIGGAILVGAGLLDVTRGNTTRGIVEIGLGRVADLIDGTLAEHTGTKSPLGEAADVIVDKVEMLVALPVLVKHDIVPVKFAAAITAQQAANTGLTYLAKKRDNEIHTSRAGKLSTGMQWASIGSYMISAAVGEHNPEIAEAAKTQADALAIGSVALGLPTIVGYARAARG